MKLIAIEVLCLGDISEPPELYAEIGLQIGPIFSEQEIIRV